MRAVLISASGLAMALGAFGVSHVTDGVVGAAFFVLALTLIPVSIGVGLANATDGHPQHSHRAAPVRHWLARHGFGRPHIAELARCGGCGKPRVVMESVWVCARCDQVPAA